MTWKVVFHFNSFQRDFPKNFSFMVNNQYNVTLLADHQVNANMQGKMSPCEMSSYEGHPHLSPLNRIALIYFNIA